MILTETGWHTKSEIFSIWPTREKKKCHSLEYTTKILYKHLVPLILVIGNTLLKQHKMTLLMDFTKWPIPKSNCYFLCSWRWRCCIQSSGSDCASDHQFLISKFRPKLKKTRKINTSARHDLNQNPYEFTVEVTKRFKGLEWINSVLEELWTEVHNIIQEAVNKTIPMKMYRR